MDEEPKALRCLKCTTEANVARYFRLPVGWLPIWSDTVQLSLCYRHAIEGLAKRTVSSCVENMLALAEHSHGMFKVKAKALGSASLRLASAHKELAAVEDEIERFDSAPCLPGAMNPSRAKLRARMQQEAEREGWTEELLGEQVAILERREREQTHYRVVRDPETLRGRHPDGEGGWVDAPLPEDVAMRYHAARAVLGKLTDAWFDADLDFWAGEECSRGVG